MAMKNAKRSSKNIVISSLVPIILLLIMGSVIGKNWPKENMENQTITPNETTNNAEANEISQQNQLISNNMENKVENEITNNVDISAKQERITKNLLKNQKQQTIKLSLMKLLLSLAIREHKAL